MAFEQTPLLEVRSVRAGYGKLDVLHEVSVRVLPGATTCLLGANGTGKSTLLKAVLGFVKCRRGEILLHGERIDAWPVHRRVAAGVRYVAQGQVVFGTMTVMENLLLGAYLRSDGMVVQQRLDWVISMFPQLGGLLPRRASVLSGGERQMVAVGRSLMVPPAVLVLDEPSAGLSPKYLHLLFEGLERAKRSGVSILLAEQNAAKALEFSDYAYVLDRGSVAVDGVASTLRDNSDFRASYLTAATGGSRSR